jgi:hypothetical protein
MQFDLFEYNRDTGMRYDVLVALEEFDAPAARRALVTLVAAFPQDAALPGLRDLIEVVAQKSDALFATHAAAAQVRQRLAGIESTALLMFEPANGRRWLARLWRETAVRATRLPFLAAESEHHAAPLFLQAGDWQAAMDAVAAIVSWRRIPAPLGWMALARYRQSGLEAAWPLLCELAWMSPGRFDTLAARLADPVITGLLKKFNAGFEGKGDVSDLAWFPAWVLVEDAALAQWLHDMQPARDGAAERAAQTLLELLRLERRGQHQAVVERRKRLQGLQPSLYAAYMKTR